MGVLQPGDAAPRPRRTLFMNSHRGTSCSRVVIVVSSCLCAAPDSGPIARAETRWHGYPRDKKDTTARRRRHDGHEHATKSGRRRSRRRLIGSATDVPQAPTNTVYDSPSWTSCSRVVIVVSSYLREGCFAAAHAGVIRPANPEARGPDHLTIAPKPRRRFTASRSPARTSRRDG